MRPLFSFSPIQARRRKTVHFNVLGLFLACAFASLAFAQTPGGTIIGTVTEIGRAHV